MSWWRDRASPGAAAAAAARTRRDYAEVGAIFLFLLAAYVILKRYDLLPQGVAVSRDMSFGFIVLIGVVAAFSSCLAVTGGLLLAVAARYNERHPALGGLQKFKPTLYFNAGRVVSYTVLGAAVGGLGSVFTLSQRGTGLLSILASLVMIVLGLQLLGLFPWMRRLQPRLPKAIAHRIHDLGHDGRNRFAPAILGALTFFLPCGFTQALQFYVLSTGSPLTGALTMLAFSLGTLPSLLSLSMIASFVRGGAQRHFLRFAGALVVLVGFWNIGGGLSLANIDLPFPSLDAIPSASAIEQVPILGGVQTAEMVVDGYDYVPARFTVQAGVPVAWKIDGRRAAGCAQVLVSSSLGVVKYLSAEHLTTIAFTPKAAGTYRFSCSMGMTTAGAAFTVVPRDPATPIATTAIPDAGGTAPVAAAPPAVAGQIMAVEISRERGFYPNAFTIKRGVRVTLRINDTVPLGGCMAVMVIPENDVTLPFQLGQNAVSFTPDRPGTIYATCSMGSRMIRFDVAS